MQLKITDVRAHPGDSAFLIDDGKTAILYDTGFAFTGYSVADNIKKVLGSRSLDYIFLTHSHYDHAAGTPYIVSRYPEAKVVAGEYAVKIFAKPTARAVMRDLDRKFAHKCGTFEYEDRLDELKVDIPVKDGDVIRAGNMDFTVVELPGHTKCSVGYYISSERLLFSTETLGVYDGGDVVVPSYLVGYQMALDSIEKAEKLGIERIVLPHYGLLTRDKTSYYLSLCRKNAMETADEIERILENGGAHDDAVAFFKEKYYRGNIPSIYPDDAMELNTGIMVNLIEKELLENQKGDKQ
ncbi:MAG: MBL fold metallo-hydrolase [Ruminococcaceae bacterium]|nr:MBL fold metallo-hydrolase [Oscillospiraceae bacterium]